MSLTRYEQETVINFNAEEAHATVYTCDPAMLRKMNKLLEARPDAVTVDAEDEYSRTYRVAKRMIQIIAPRIYSDEQRKAARDRMTKTKQTLPVKGK